MRALQTTYESAREKLGLDRGLALHLSKQTSTTVQDTGWRLARCSDDHNIWFINAPESGWLHGRFWKCRSRLCSFCLSYESGRRRKVLRQALADYPGSTDAKRWRFLTLTIENPHLSIHGTRQIVNAAWSKFRKRACFAVVEAGAKSEEFTLTRNGYHYHIHSLLHFASPPDYQIWRKNWTECVETSGGGSNRLYGYDTVDGYLVANFKKVRRPQDLTNELCKYITKSTRFNTLSNATITELAECKRWHRMFELIGQLRGNKDMKTNGVSERHSIVHKNNLSDGSKTDRWWFEKKRTEQRYFQVDHLEQLFGTHVWNMSEIRNIIISNSAATANGQEESSQ